MKKIKMCPDCRRLHPNWGKDENADCCLHCKYGDGPLCQHCFNGIMEKGEVEFDGGADYTTYTCLACGYVDGDV
jgi:C4-type Zn-finger protein